MKDWFKTGRPWIWLTAGAVSVSLIAVLGLLALIAWRGLSFFWPAEIHEIQVQASDGSTKTVIGELYDTEEVPMERLAESGIVLENYSEETLERWLLKVGNREYVPLDFMWIMEPQIVADAKPLDVAKIERSKNGNFYGYITDVLEQGESVFNSSPEQSELREELAQRIERVLDINDQAEDLQNSEIGAINYRLNQLRLERRALALKEQLTDSEEQRIAAEEAQLRADYKVLEEELFAMREEASRDSIVVRDMRGMDVTIPMYRVLDVTFPNDMGAIAKVGYFFSQIGNFVSENPREANTEGGVFPAIFGTVFMVLLMSVIVTPFGVVAAIYLHEYAGKNPVTRLIRIAVINLAGVPSIVYGVFGLGFFVYMVGGSLDQIFYPEALPSPTFGTPGVMWSAITLAILTLPVVIVSTEEGLSRIPSSLREGSLALGATKAETLWRIIIPMASPAIMTGLILAVARAAGEVAPLMLVGVVKSAPMLPVDGNFPYFHLDRKFMHLGFHIYDVGFQSPNVEAARPLVYATSFLLVTVIVGLNLTAISVRNHLREKYRSLEH
ncbi:phosphate ABC transporter, permease protein PstA [Pseudidiomarina taiwanensis]|uniref:Phosphate transport system permease protein PstA n=2 Tax=Pseudidiomarina taiwanensis TaxID=337250 RepID=A0A432ZCI7_9GAMM|nr:phosphate ABC transporter, permease protein PstA [Pseudidiomarina taiwanensis]